MKYCCLLLQLILFPALLFAQSKYKPGYVVTLKGDTLRGNIRYVKAKHNGYILLRTPGKAERKLAAVDIDAFAINHGNNQDQYKRFVGRISMDAISEDHMLIAPDTSYRTDAVFLTLLESGKHALLYSYTDDIKTRFYIAETPNEMPVELVYKLYYDSDYVGFFTGRTVNQDTYMQQLFALAIKNNVLTDMLQKDIEESGYRKYYLQQIIKKINAAGNR